MSQVESMHAEGTPKPARDELSRRGMSFPAKLLEKVESARASLSARTEADKLARRRKSLTALSEKRRQVRGLSTTAIFQAGAELFVSMSIEDQLSVLQRFGLMKARRW